MSEWNGGTLQMMLPAPRGGSRPSMRETSDEDERSLIRRYALRNGDLRKRIIEGPRGSYAGWITDRMRISVEYEYSRDEPTRIERVILIPSLNLENAQDEDHVAEWRVVPERLLDMFIIRSQVVRIKEYNSQTRRIWPARDGTVGITLRYLLDCLAEHIRVVSNKYGILSVHGCDYHALEVFLQKRPQWNDFILFRISASDEHD